MLEHLDSSSQLTKWMYTPEQHLQCRKRANYEARKAIASSSSSSPKESANDAGGGGSSVDADRHQSAGPLVLSVQSFAGSFKSEPSPSSEDTCMDMDGPLENSGGHKFLNVDEEALLVAFYTSKLTQLIGPQAAVPRLRRDIKVAATSALLMKRFFLSNSVMIHDPKAIMVAAAFLGSKVEDATADVRYLEDGTKLMDAPVLKTDIIPAELNLLGGVDFDLLCFHPYKAVLALTEDLRTFLKSEKGRNLAYFEDDAERKVVGQDLKSIHDEARNILDDVIVSDIPLLFSPGQTGLASLMVANEQLLENNKKNTNSSSNNSGPVPKIDFLGYIHHRWEEELTEKEKSGLNEKIAKLCRMIKGLTHGQYGCGNHVVDLQQLKAINKKLKKCRVWGKKEKKDKKRKASGGDGGDTKRKKK